MSTTSNLKQGLLAGLVICVLAAGCSSNGGRGDTSIADNDTTTTTTQSVEEPSTTTEAEPTTTTTLGVAEPSTTAEAEPATTADSDADITTTTTVDDPTTTSDGDTHDGEVVVVPETDIGDPDEPTVVIPTTASTQPATTEPSTTEAITTTEPSTTTAPSTTTPTTTSVQPEVSQGVVCGKWLVKLDEFVTETDNGCRQADCVVGRNEQTGECRGFGEWLDTLVRDCPTVDTSDGLGMYGGDIFIVGGPGITTIRSEPADPVFPRMVPGSSWIAHIQLVDNDNWDWKEGGLEPTDLSHYFGVGVSAGPYVPRVGEEQKAGSTIFTTKEPEGSWTLRSRFLQATRRNTFSALVHMREAGVAGLCASRELVNEPRKA